MSLFRRPAARHLAAACIMASSSVGVHAEAVRQNTVNFSATAHREVVQDELTVVLEAVKDGGQAAEVQAELKRVLEAALAEARAQIAGAAPEAISVQTGGFHLYPRYGNNSRISGWQGTAQLIISGTDAGKVSTVSGRLNQLNITQVRYGLSRALREQHEASLTSDAIRQFRARARQLAADFGMRGYTLGAVAVSSTDAGFEGRPMLMMPMARAAAAPMADAALPVAPGKGLLTINVSGDVLLTP
jgi:predicted secreted protein